MVISFVAGTLLVIGWIVVAFVIAVPAGWVHLLLAAGTVMIARGIVLSPAAKAGADVTRADRGGQGRTEADKR